MALGGWFRRGYKDDPDFDLTDAPSQVRGPYDRDERRVPFRKRKITDPWTPMEAAVFNAITQHCDRQGVRVRFSQRLEIAELMLEVFDREVRR